MPTHFPLYGLEGGRKDEAEKSFYKTLRHLLKYTFYYLKTHKVYTYTCLLVVIK